AFGCIGIAVITGHLPLTGSNAFFEQQIAPQAVDTQLPVLATKPSLPTMAAVDSRGETVNTASEERKAILPSKGTTEPTVN
ncbi:MAG: hypothetical protein ABI612_16950, partial [Betaproteobacteria bacterium]